MFWMRIGLLAAVIALLVIVTMPEMQNPAQQEAPIITLGTPGKRVAARVFSGTRVGPHPRLVVVIHGDAPGHDPVYQYDFARALAADLDNTIVLAVLRPGFRDGMGASSDGDRGLGVGDNYTENNARQLSDAVIEAASRLHAADVRLIGHSGGAAMALIMLSMRPDLASGALIASCPCDLGPWRRHMAWRDLNPLFLLPTSSVSPLTRIDRLPQGLDLRIMVGEKDPIAPPRFSERLLQSAKAHGINVQMTIVPDIGHELLESPEMLDAARAFVQATSQKDSPKPGAMNPAEVGQAANAARTFEDQRGEPY